ncbi:hypothetical protein V1L54_28320 [Streptomyces sp. TRM 70361]|uniref:hypothetical protein n=1 Tax=Streptomyces sp. TRM 70361 TaxID=3116553 RepID=UPI002E7B25D1|nr:hypothetical protein [Streptomyces sp. TRM 70361]MEE1943264.1 hypothetical protein [Streptomyces sp. TRM 70361]
MDRRLIQTAVFGSPDSDEPALCPEDPEELVVFRREHVNDTIWCGTKLEGGCGRQLTTRLCTDKVCHFAHYASEGVAHQCSVRARDRDSANHLFVRRDFSLWARTQGISVAFEYPEPLGSAVLIRMEDGRVILIHLDKTRPVVWDSDTTWEVVLGPGVRIDPDVLARRGYVHRIRFVDQPGVRRSVRAGTETPGEGTRWFGLNQLVLTADRLAAAEQPETPSTPPSATVEKRTSEQAQRTIVSVAPSVKAPVSRPDDSGWQAVQRLDKARRENQPRQVEAALRALQRLLDSDGGHDLDDVRAAVLRGQQWQAQRARLRKTVVARLQEDFEAGRSTTALLPQAMDLVGDADAPADERAAVLSIRDQVRRAEEEKREARAREEAERHEAWARARAERMAAAEQAVMERRERDAQQLRSERLRHLAPAVRGALKKAASEGRVTTWPDVEKRIGQHQLARLDHQDKIELLLLVESNTKAEDPLWSTLFAAQGDEAALQLHREVAHRLGRSLPVSDTELLSQLAAERSQLHRRQ